MRRKSVLLIGVVVVVAVLLAVVLVRGGNRNDNMNMTNTPRAHQSSQSSAAVTTSTVGIQNYTFTPSTIKVKVGTKVTWTNKDDIGHTITADASSSDAPDSGLITKNQSYSFTFTKAGTYTYHCTPHPYMKGTVVVTN